MQNCILPLALESQFRRRARALLDGNSAVDSTADAFVLRGNGVPARRGAMACVCLVRVPLNVLLVPLWSHIPCYEHKQRGKLHPNPSARNYATNVFHSYARACIVRPAKYCDAFAHCSRSIACSTPRRPMVTLDDPLAVRHVRTVRKRSLFEVCASH